MKRYKKLLLQIGILLFICGIFLFILEQQKKFVTVDFSKQYENNKTIELSDFEQNENWQGNLSYDSERVLSGKTSVTLTSWYGKATQIKKASRILLGNGMDKGYLELFIPDAKEKDSLARLMMTLSNDKQKQDFELLSGLTPGWNRLPLVIPAWKDITAITFTITSKNDKIAAVNLDRLWIENTSQYSADIVSSTSRGLSLRTIGDRTYLFMAAPATETLPFVQPSRMNRGEVTLGIIPEHTGTLSLSLDGTAVSVSKGTGTCSLSSSEKNRESHILRTTKIEDDTFLFIRAHFDNGKIAYALSNNGVQYEECGAVPFSRLSPVTLSVKGSYLLDSYAAEY